MNSKIWEINGLSLELDLGDADVMERYENAFKEMAASENTVPKDGKMSNIIRAYCGLFHKLFDSIFGEGTSARIFKGVPTSCAAYDEIHSSFLEFAKNQMTELASIFTKYTPNRQQRRSAKKKK